MNTHEYLDDRFWNRFDCSTLRCLLRTGWQGTSWEIQRTVRRATSLSVFTRKRWPYHWPTRVRTPQFVITIWNRIALCTYSDAQVYWTMRIKQNTTRSARRDHSRTIKWNCYTVKYSSRKNTRMPRTKNNTL